MDIRKIIQEELRRILSKDINKTSIEVSELYIEGDNMSDAYFKSKNNLGPSSMSTGHPLAVTKLLDGSLLLLDGHHRIADKIKYLDSNNIEDILKLKFDAIITTENYEVLDDYPDGEYWIPFIDWIYVNVDKLSSTKSLSTSLHP